MGYDVVIGLELHIELKTKSKMFSSSPVSYGLTPNTSACFYDISFPGQLPSINKEAVIKAIQVCHAFNMQIDNELWFDRKNYYYSDLPKGYQITQEKRPIGKNGFITIKGQSFDKIIQIQKLHLEEDTCKQIHYDEYSLIDYNRAGIPLIEVVSEPVIKNSEEAMLFVDKVRSIVVDLDASNGKMEEGSLRCDINISLRDDKSKPFGTKVEIKNLNSISNIGKAIDFEILRQSKLLNSSKPVNQETRRYDDDIKETVLMRIKSDNVDYRCFIDPNIPPIKLSDEFIESAIKSSNELTSERYKRYISLGLSIQAASQISNSISLAKYYDELIKCNVEPYLAYKWLFVNVLSYLNKEGNSIDEFPISPKELGELLKNIERNRISNKQGREIFDKMLKGEKDPNQIIIALGYDSSLDTSDLNNIVANVIRFNSQAVNDVNNGKNKAFSYLVGLVLKEVKGKCNPNIVKDKIMESIKGK